MASGHLAKQRPLSTKHLKENLDLQGIEHKWKGLQIPVISKWPKTENMLPPYIIADVFEAVPSNLVDLEFYSKSTNS